ncbi:hypothetical protein ES703_109835 [subsurface metagenome]
MNGSAIGLVILSKSSVVLCRALLPSYFNTAMRELTARLSPSLPKALAVSSRTSQFSSHNTAISGSNTGLPVLPKISAAASRTSPFLSFNASINGPIVWTLPILTKASTAASRTLRFLSLSTAMSGFTAWLSLILPRVTAACLRILLLSCFKAAMSGLTVRSPPILTSVSVAFFRTSGFLSSSTLTSAFTVSPSNSTHLPQYSFAIK